MTRPASRVAARAVAAALAAASPAAAGTIDTLSATSGTPFGFLPGIDSIAGGVFVADDVLLESFALEAYAIAAVAGLNWRSVVMSVFNGTPATVLWQSAPFDLHGAPDDLHAFAPGLSLVPGAKYFIGVHDGRYDSGLPGGSYWVEYARNNPIGGADPDVRFVYNDGDRWLDLAGADVAARIMMTNPTPPPEEPTAPVPLPGGLALLGSALLAAGAASRRGRPGRGFRRPPRPGRLRPDDICARSSQP